MFNPARFVRSCLIRGTVLALALAVLIPRGAAVQADSLTETSRLPNGLTLMTERRPESRVAGVAIAVRAGSRYEDDTTDSAAKMLERMYLQGTESRPSRDELIRPITRLGGDLSVSAGFESLVFQTSVRASDLDVALDVMSDVLVRSRLDANKFEKERELAIQELIELEDQAPALAGYTFQRAIYNGQSMGRVPRGTLDGLNELTPETMLAFRDAFVGANRTVIAVVSPRPHADVRERVAAAFADLAPASERASLPTDYRDSSTGRTDIVAGLDQAVVLVGVGTPGAQHPDRAPLAILVSALNGFTGRLMHEIRDVRGLAYGTSASTRSASDAGTFVAQAGTEPSNAEAVLTLLEAELRRLADTPLTEDELRRAIGQAVGQRLLDNESALSRASEMAGLWAVGVEETVEELEARLQAVTAADVQRVAQAYLTSDRLFRLVAQP